MREIRNPWDVQVAPDDVASWLRHNGWRKRGEIPDLISLWQRDQHEVVLPLAREATDFSLRWRELLETLSTVTNEHPSVLAFEMSYEGADIAELKIDSSAQADGTISLSDGEVLLTSARHAVVAAANASLQRRAYFGHSIPRAAREHARSVRMGQTRHGSYIVPIISRLPDLASMSHDDLALFHVGEEPFERRVMSQLAESISAIEGMAVERGKGPSVREMNESVRAGVSHELCAAVANIIETTRTDQFTIDFTWARRLQPPRFPSGVTFPKSSARIIRQIAEQLRGSGVVANQTVRGYVIGLKRDEEEEFGTVTVRIGASPRRRQVTMLLDAYHYDMAMEANRQRRPVAATGQLLREPGRAWKLDSVQNFGMAHDLMDSVDTET